MNYRISKIEEIIFVNKQNIPWKSVEQYCKRYIGQTYIVEEYQDHINISSDFPDEYTESKYTKKLRGALAKVKANAAQIIGVMIENATNRRWSENKDDKHKCNASGGWFRYDTYFEMSVKGSNETVERFNQYKATLVVRKTNRGLFLYDVLDIKKEASTPLESEMTVR
ncbi:MAG: hypothetical protein IIW54_02120 [Lachnospiraceae bacterium]|nr:hypothetical protein [Lachnospiraceae bacterium]